MLLLLVARRGLVEIGENPGSGWEKMGTSEDKKMETLDMNVNHYDNDTLANSHQ